MSTDATAHEVRELLGSIVGSSVVDSIGAEDLIFEQGIVDSLHLIELLELVQSRFQFEVASEELSPENFESIAAITRYVSTKTGR